MILVSDRDLLEEDEPEMSESTGTKLGVLVENLSILSDGVQRADLILSELVAASSEQTRARLDLLRDLLRFVLLTNRRDE